MSGSIALYLGLAIGPFVGEAALRAIGYDGAWLVGAAAAALATVLCVAVPETAPSVLGSVDGERPPRGRLFHPAGVLPGLLILTGTFGMAGFLAFVPLHAADVGLEDAGLPLALYALVVVGLRIVFVKLPDQVGAARLSGAALVFVGDRAGRHRASHRARSGCSSARPSSPVGSPSSSRPSSRWRSRASTTTERGSVVGTSSAVPGPVVRPGPGHPRASSSTRSGLHRPRSSSPRPSPLVGAGVIAVRRGSLVRGARRTLAAMTVERVFVAGAGLMGHGIAQVHAAIGKDVVLYEPDLARAEAGRERIAGNLQRAVDKGKTRCARLATRPWPDLTATDDLAAAATPTSSSRPCSRTSASSTGCGATWTGSPRRPRSSPRTRARSPSIAWPTPSRRDRRVRFIGMHFFSPVPVMPLVELIRSRRHGRRDGGRRSGTSPASSASRSSCRSTGRGSSSTASSCRSWPRRCAPTSRASAAPRTSTRERGSGSTTRWGRSSWPTSSASTSASGSCASWQDGLGLEHLRPPHVLERARRGRPSRPEDRARLLHLPAVLTAGAGGTAAPVRVAGTISSRTRSSMSRSNGLASTDTAWSATNAARPASSVSPLIITNRRARSGSRRSHRPEDVDARHPRHPVVAQDRGVRLAVAAAARASRAARRDDRVVAERRRSARRRNTRRDGSSSRTRTRGRRGPAADRGRGRAQPARRRRAVGRRLRPGDDGHRRGRDRAGTDRQVEREGGAATPGRRAVAQLPAVGGDDPVRDRQAEPGAVGRRLGREERLEQAPDVLRRDARAVVHAR